MKLDPLAIDLGWWETYGSEAPSGVELRESIPCSAVLSRLPPYDGLEWVDDIEEFPGQFTEEVPTACDTPQAKRPTMRACPPPPGDLDEEAPLSLSSPARDDDTVPPPVCESGPYRPVVTVRQALAYLTTER